MTAPAAPTTPEARMEIGCPHGAWGMVVACPHCGMPRHVSPSQHVTDRFLSEVERGERDWPSAQTTRTLDDHGEFIGPPTRLEVERYGLVTLINWIPRFLRWHLWRRWR